MKKAVIILIKAGSKVYDLNKRSEFVSKAEFSGKLVQKKLGLLYYKANGSMYRVAQNDANIILQPENFVHAVSA